MQAVLIHLEVSQRTGSTEHPADDFLPGLVAGEGHSEGLGWELGQCPHFAQPAQELKASSQGEKALKWL